MNADQSTSVGATVEIDVFSGRPNPSFTLDQPATRELLGLLADLKRSPGEAAPRDGLGFRGFTVSAEGQPRFYISGPAVSAGSGQFVDKPRTVERFLLSKIPLDMRRQFTDALPR